MMKGCGWRGRCWIGGGDHHFCVADHQAADIRPFAMFFACRALNAARRALSAALSPFRGGLPLTPYWPKRISW